MMSSNEIIFAPDEGLRAGMNAQILVAWPFLLDGHIRLQLVLEASITASEDGLLRNSRTLDGGDEFEAYGLGLGT